MPYTTCEYAFVTCTYIFITILLEYLANCAVPSTFKSFPHFDEYTTDPKKHCVEKKVINEQSMLQCKSTIHISIVPIKISLTGRSNV